MHPLLLNLIAVKSTCIESAKHVISDGKIWKFSFFKTIMNWFLQVQISCTFFHQMIDDICIFEGENVRKNNIFKNLLFSLTEF